jgi:hypothetical protein
MNPSGENKAAVSRIQIYFEKLFWILPLAFYWITASRFAGWVDSPMIVKHVLGLDTSSWVNSHNLFLIMGKFWSWFFPFGEPHYKLNLLCGVFAATAVYFLFRTALLITNKLWPCVWGSLAVMFSHSLWWHATILEVYTLNAALLSLILFFVVRYEKTNRVSDIYAACFCWGLGCLNHVLMGLFAAGFLASLVLLVRRRSITISQLFVAVFFFLMAFQVYLFIFLKELNTNLNGRGAFSYSNLWDAFKFQIDNSTGGHFKKAMFPAELSPEQRLNWRLNYILLLFLNFPSIIFPLGFFGLWKLLKNNQLRITATFLIASLFAQVLWSANYIIWDMFAFGMPVWLMFGFLGTLGLAWVWPGVGWFGRVVRASVVTVFIGPILYSMAPKMAKEPGFWQSYFHNFVDVNNYWSTADYFGNPNKFSYDLVDRVAQSLFSKLPQGANILDSDGKGHYPFSLYYQSVLGRRPDIKFIPIFSPTFKEEQAAVLAQKLDKLLRSGEPVFVSSITYPERAVLNYLYANASGDGRASVSFAAGLDPQNFVSTFPEYELKKIELLPNYEAYIYQITPRAALEAINTDRFIIEGESLTLSHMTGGTGHCLSQSLGPQWSGGGHLLCIDNEIGTEIQFTFEIPHDFAGQIKLLLSKSYDFGVVGVTLDGADFGKVDLYSKEPSLSEELVIQGNLKAGMKTLSVQVIGSNKESEPRFGFGIDRLLFIKSDS